MQIDAIQQGATELALIAQDLIRRAAAGFALRAQITTRAGVHGGEQLETGRKFGAACGPGDGDVAGFQRFAQGLKDTPIKFGQLIQKEHAVVGKADLARPG